MDILSHGFWTTIAFKEANKKFKKPNHIWQTAFWGMFPDLLAFATMFIWLFARFFSGGISFSEIHSEFLQAGMSDASPSDILPIFSLTWMLYTIGHSAITFLLVFGALFLILGRPVWVIRGWLFHILIASSTHSYKVYPTPVLWPLSGWKFNGILWSQPWFVFLDYAAIVLVLFIIWKKGKNNIKSRLIK